MFFFVFHRCPKSTVHIVLKQEFFTDMSGIYYIDFLDVVHHRNKTVAVLKRFKGLNDVIVCTGKLVEVAFGQCRLFALSQESCPSLMSRTRRGRFICYYCNAHVPIQINHQLSFKTRSLVTLRHGKLQS